MKTLALIIAVLFAPFALAQSDPGSLDTGLKVVVFSSTQSCAACRVYAPTVKLFKQQHPEAKVIYIDVNEQPELMQDFEVTRIPTTMILVDGEPQYKAIGAINIRQLTQAFKNVFDKFGNGGDEDDEDDEQPVEPVKPKKIPKYFFGWSPAAHSFRPPR